MSLSAMPSDPENAISARRTVTAAVVGLVAASPLAFLGEPELVPVIAWIVAALLVLIWTWARVWPEDHVGTQRLAEQESRTHTTDTEVLVASAVSIAAVIVALVRARAQNAEATASVILSVVAVVLSWCVVNTVFALKYARLYYLDEDGGIDFKQPEPPAYSDFAYMAFTVGMSFAVSDTEPTSTAIRRTALGHALLSYVLGTGILAVAVNLVSNVGQ